MKKILSGFLITTLLVTNFAFLAPVPKAYAGISSGSTVFDVPNTVQGVIQAIFGEKSWVGELLGKALGKLAGKVLNKMLKKTVNWAISGFGPWEGGGNSGGQPFYVQNQDSLIKNIEDQQLLMTIQELGEGCQDGNCPYAKDLARTLVRNAISGNKNSLGQFDGDQYSDNWEGFIDGQFSEGGWAAWEGMYRNPQNSQLGSFLTTTFHVEDKKQASVGKELAQINQNAGFLSLRKCVAYKDGKGPSEEIDFGMFTNNKWNATDTASQVGNGNTEPVFTTTGSTLPPTGGDFPEGTNSGAINTTGISTIGGTTNSSGITTVSTAYTGAANQGLSAQVGDYFDDTYALPGMTVDNCERYETTTPGSMAKEMLGKSLTATIDKQIADSSTGRPILDSLVDMAAVFVEQGLDKLITKATTKTGEQKIFAGGIEDQNTVFLGAGNGSATNSAWYSENGKDPIVIQDPYDATKLHPDILAGIELTKQELTEVEVMLEMLRAQPNMYKQLDECLPGPDLDWVQRLKDEFSRSAKRLDKKSIKDNKKGDKAQEATARLERYRDQQISKTKLEMLKIIPSAIPIQGKINQVTNLGSGISQAEQKYTRKVSVLATLAAIQESLASGSLNDFELIELKKQYAGIKSSISSEETLQDTTEDKQKIEADMFTSFDWANPKSLISKCIEERKKLTDTQIGEDLGETLFCEWQTHNTESSKTMSTIDKIGTYITITSGLGGLTGVGLDGKVTIEAGIGSSLYDPGRSVQVLIGDQYTQDEAPFDDDGKNGEFNVDCSKYYRASMSLYEDFK